jgi:methyltransferase (TIGR00027 family)
MPFARQAEWSFTARTYLGDRMILAEIARGADVVVNLAAGLDARPYRLDLPASLRWVEVDLPQILDYKEEILAGETPRCRLDRIRLDLSDRAGRQALFARLGGEARRALVVSEGLVIYLDAEQVGALASDLAAVPTFERWLLDMSSPGLVKMLRERMGDLVAKAGAPYKFAPPEGPAFFEQYGWRPIEVHSLLKAASRLHRLRGMLRVFGWLPESNRPAGNRPWSGSCLFENARRGAA